MIRLKNCYGYKVACSVDGEGVSVVRTMQCKRVGTGVNLITRMMLSFNPFFNLYGNFVK